MKATGYTLVSIALFEMFISAIVSDTTGAATPRWVYFTEGASFLLGVNILISSYLGTKISRYLSLTSH